MKKISRICIQATLALMVLFSVVTTAYALEGDYTVLAPLPGTTKNCDAGTGGVANCKTDWSTYLQGSFKFAIGLAAGMAFVMITFGGIVYATSDAITGKSQGKEYIENALWGLGLVLGAWIILNTINPQILSFNLNIKKPDLAGKYGMATIVAGVPMTQADLASDQTVRNQLSAAGIGVNHSNPCKAGETQGCTNLNGLAVTTVTGVEALKTSCSANGASCNVTITGATEPGHTTGSCHNSGTCVDLTTTAPPTLITGGSTPADCTKYSYKGGTYMWESKGATCGGEVASSDTHWHVTYP